MVDLEKSSELLSEIKKQKRHSFTKGCCCGCCLSMAISGSLGIAGKVAEDWPRIYPKNLEGVINYYQRQFSQNLPTSSGEKVCLYEPSCSQYALDAIAKYGQTRGAIMATKRILRCNPLSSGGYDPVV
jgi:hypothetical protein